MSTDHVATVRDLKADKEEMERRIQQERVREADMLARLNSERTTLADLTSSVTHLQQTLAKVKEQGTALDGELGSVRKEVSAQRGEKERQGRTLAEMRRRDDIELSTLESALGWRFDGVGRESTRVAPVRGKRY